MTDYAALREKMVRSQLIKRGIADKRVLATMSGIPRERFLADELKAKCYHDGPLPIGQGQTISQPYIVAKMTEALNLSPESRVLEIGSGCGYQTAVLAELVADVYSIELVYELYTGSRKLLAELGYKNIHLRQGDGSAGWPEEAPFDAILVAAASPDEPPPKLIEQLAPGGRLALPVGETDQILYLLTKEQSGIKTEELFPVRFVPLRQLPG